MQEPYNTSLNLTRYVGASRLVARSSQVSFALGVKEYTAMTEIKELDVVALVSSISAEIIGEARTVLVQAQTKGTVVLVHENDGQVAAFEVEFFLGKNEYALATVPCNQVNLVSVT